MSARLAEIALRCAWESALLGLFTAGLFRFLPGLAVRAKLALASLAFVLAIALPFCPPTAFALTPATQAYGVNPALIALPNAAAPALACAWLLLSAASLLRLAISALSLRKLLRTAGPAAPELLALYRGFSRGRARRARLLLSDDLAAPGACGLLRPAILLPRSLPAGLSRDDLASILRHEAAHLDGGDDWLALGLRLARALVPFAFGAASIERRILACREILCDEAALRPGFAPKRYAACLARLAEASGQARQTRANALAPSLGGSQLSLRIGHILSGAQGRGPGRLRSAAASFAGGVLCLGLLSTPSVFSFGSAPAAIAAAQTPAALFPAAHIRPASYQLPPRVLAAAPGRRGTVHHRRVASIRRQPVPQPAAVYPAVLWTAPQPRVFLLIPAVQALPAIGWTRFFLFTI